MSPDINQSNGPGFWDKGVATLLGTFQDELHYFRFQGRQNILRRGSHRLLLLEGYYRIGH